MQHAALASLVIALGPFTCAQQSASTSDPAPTPATDATSVTPTVAAPAVAATPAPTSTPRADAPNACGDALFTDVIAPGQWAEVRIDGGGMDAIRTAIAESDRGRPTRITIAAGTYRGQCLYVEDHMRTAAAPLWIRGEGTVQIDCNDGNGQALGFDHVAYVAIEGLTVGPATGHYGDSAVHIAGKPIDPNTRASYGKWDPSHHVIVRGMVARNLHRGADGDGDPDAYESGCCDGIKVNQAHHIWLLDNRISRTARHGIDNVGVHDLWVCGNVLEDMVGAGVGIEAKGGSEDVLLEGNLIRRARHRGIMLGGEGSGNIYMWPWDADYEGRNQVARNNVIIDAAEAGLGFYGCHDCLALHNTVWVTGDHAGRGDYDMIRAYNSVMEGGDDYWGGSKRVGDVLANRDLSVVANLFGAADGSSTCPLNANADGVAGLSLSGNWWWNGGEPLRECGEGRTSITASRDRASHYGGDPKVVAGRGRRIDLRPAAGSGLVGAAMEHAQAPAVDRSGRRRPSPRSIGALEP